ncbi:hypothetical protein E4U42_001428 [Claviceps africana]|uniref:BAG domain-containing protein n=1 Tax=Claviceps africana TaxID=83212 RepID=A0A8K0JBS8_9HYPO|nr:hypothetical protein E4U42_001428 [Claviceps africana]
MSLAQASSDSPAQIFLETSNQGREPHTSVNTFVAGTSNTEAQIYSTSVVVRDNLTPSFDSLELIATGAGHTFRLKAILKRQSAFSEAEVSCQGSPSPTDDKVDSSQPIAATSGAFQNFTSYLNGTLASLGTAFQGSNEYISETLGVAPSLVYSGLAALVALPLTMSRYGWSLNREPSSPYSSTTAGVPAVTDEDFSYITSKDLEDPSFLGTRSGAGAPSVEDDVLIIKNKGITYPTHFPAYTIGDGKLRVKDVRDRAGLMMDLSERDTRHIKLLYKGQQLKESAAPVRDYGVKNKSELMAVLADARDDGSTSGEEMVIVDDCSAARPKKRKNKKRGGKTRGGGDLASSSPRDGTPNVNGAPPSPEEGLMKRLDELSDEFSLNLQPLCKAYIAAPPKDKKQRIDEHRKLTETVLANILLKLDEVDTQGIAEVRARRKELVRGVQEVLKSLDAAKAS